MIGQWFDNGLLEHDDDDDDDGNSNYSLQLAAMNGCA
jgi:hypothetical protein